MTKPVNRPHRKKGRPRKDSPPPRAAARIEKLAASGHSVVGIARAFGTSKEIVARWCDELPALAEALARGRESERFELHNYLYRTAMDPKVATRDRSFAAVYLLNNRHGYVSGDQSDTANKVSINFTLPGAMKPEDFLKAIEHEPTSTNQPLPAARLTRA